MELYLPADGAVLITSDLHLGSPYSRTAAFRTLLGQLPEGVILVLNGDTFDNPAVPLAGEHNDTAIALEHAARQRRVIALAGNHDHERARDITGIETAPELLLPGRLLAIHGDGIETMLPTHRWFVHAFRRFHSLRVRLGADDVHVAEYAKRWRLAYRVLVNHQRQNAVRLARTREVPAITCGHVHFGEDTTVNGIRYLNTGAWTESPVFAILVTPTAIRFIDAAEIMADTWPADTEREERRPA